MTPANMVFFCVFCLFCLSPLFFMGEVNLASLNVNGARDIKKRAQVFELIKNKGIDVFSARDT